MPTNQPTDEPRPGGAVPQPQPQPQPSGDPQAPHVERLIEVEEHEEPAKPE